MRRRTSARSKASPGDEGEAGGLGLLQKFADRLDPAQRRLGVLEVDRKRPRRVEIEDVGLRVPGLLVDQLHGHAIFGKRQAQAAAERIEGEVDEARHVRKLLTLTLSTRYQAGELRGDCPGPCGRIRRAPPSRQENPDQPRGSQSSQMLILQIVVLALIQGITEFLPISSSGHLLLVPALTGWPDQGLLTDVMVHMGSFLAVVVYFWRDCVNLTLGRVDLLRGKLTGWGKLALLIVLGTIPAVLFGVFLDKIGFMEMVRQMPEVVAWNAIIFGILLYLCDRYGLSSRRMSDMTWVTALIIGVAQAHRHHPRHQPLRHHHDGGPGPGLRAARGGALRLPARHSGDRRRRHPEARRCGGLRRDHHLRHAAAAILTFFVALGTITVLMKLVRHMSFLPFAVYRVLLGIVLLGLIYSGMPLGAVN